MSHTSMLALLGLGLALTVHARPSSHAPRPDAHAACLPLVPARSLLSVRKTSPPAGHHASFPYFSALEKFPGEVTSELAAIPAGLYLTVGTDRGFNHASLSAATALVLLAPDPCAVRFNAINAWLLSVARDREDYVWLRLHGGAGEWEQRAQGKPVRALLERQPNGKLRPLRATEALGWWRSWVRDSRNFRDIESPPESSRQSEANFRRANYLYYQDQFQRLQEMAQQGRIVSLARDLSDAEGIASALEKRRLKIAALDFGGAWEKQYLTPARTVALVHELARLAVPEARVVFTQSRGARRYAFVSFRKVTSWPASAFERAPLPAPR